MPIAVEAHITYYPNATPLLEADSSLTPTPSSIPTRAPTRETITPTATSLPVLKQTRSSPSATPTFHKTATASDNASIPTPAKVLPPVINPAPSPTSSLGAQAREDTITINSYAWRSALVPSSPDDLIYPYPHLDFGRLGGVISITLKVIVLENSSAKITICPELGGRILRWFNKKLGREILYANSVLKPTHWGFRGWWLATGGIEWAFPTNEHGLNEWRPWEYTLKNSPSEPGIVVFDRESKTGLDISVGIKLMTDGSITISPYVRNATSKMQSFQFWINAMLPFSQDVRFALPTTSVLVHSTGDESLPQPYKSMSWPIFNGRNFSHANEWRNYLGVFAENITGGSVSVVYPDGSRITRYFPMQMTKGIKLFLLGDLPSDLYTDDGSRYLEFWGGLTRTFAEDYVLGMGQQVSWTEVWQLSTPQK